jgi:uncharacterized protein (DUF2236 family)
MNRLVSDHDLEEHLRGLTPEDPSGGVFGPASVTWRIAGRTALFVGAWRAALLQLAHPAVARAIEEHSATTRDPVGRFRGTFRVIYTFIYGDWPRVESAARRLHARHTGIVGSLKEGSSAHPAGSAYAATEPSAMRWVLYTLWDTALRVHDELVHPLTAEEKDAYVREGTCFARLFGLDPNPLPTDWRSLQAAMERAVTSGEIAVTPTARKLADYLLRPPNLPASGLWSPSVRAVTAHWMPESLRADFGFAPGDDRAARRWITAARWGHRLLPQALAWVPAWHEAHRRLAGKAGHPYWLRWLNRRWLGVESLVS